MLVRSPSGPTVGCLGDREAGLPHCVMHGQSFLFAVMGCSPGVFEFYSQQSSVKTQRESACSHVIHGPRSTNKIRNTAGKERFRKAGGEFVTAVLCPSLVLCDPVDLRQDRRCI